jgi:hypothetical protein
MTKSIDGMEAQLQQGLVGNPEYQVYLESSIGAMRETQSIEQSRLERHRETLRQFNARAPKVSGNNNE